MNPKRRHMFHRTFQRQQSALQAFTLVEILVAMAIFVTLMTFIALAQHNISKSTKRILGITGLYHESQALMKRLRADLSNRLPSSFLHLSTSPGDSQSLTCLTTVARNPTDLSEMIWNVERRTHELLYVHWRYDPEEGLLRGVSPAAHNGDGTRTDQYVGADAPIQDNDDERFDTMHFTNEYGRMAVPVRTYAEFINQGDLTDTTTLVQEAIIYGRLSEINGVEYDLPTMALAHPTYYLGNTWDLVNAGGSATASAMLPPLDGWDFVDEINKPELATYHKSRVFLFGLKNIDGQDCNIYPTQVNPITQNCELFEMSMQFVNGAEHHTGSLSVDGLHLDNNHYFTNLTNPLTGDGSSPNTRADIEDRLDDISLDRRDILRQQPQTLQVRFLLHNMPYDPNYDYQDDTAPVGTINFLRSEFFALPPADRAGDQGRILLQRLIESRGYTAMPFAYSLRMP